ncbi:hypothetical protein [Ponticoccus sp. (in: a-proteobacteria)]|uniref:hypothetical protein n=1 Tax=Ponticoccus sp. (in: a-proteobacteria) TaxID=1925025 RepID=UPI003AB2902C
MDRLSLYISLLTHTVVTGSLIVAFLAMGYYSWQAIAVAVVIGVVAAWPLAKLISRRIKTRDPAFNPPPQQGDPARPAGAGKLLNRSLREVSARGLRAAPVAASRRKGLVAVTLHSQKRSAQRDPANRATFSWPGRS